MAKKNSIPKFPPMSATTLPRHPDAITKLRAEAEKKMQSSIQPKKKK